MRYGLVMVGILLMAFACSAELTHIERIVIEDVDKWVNFSSPSEVLFFGDKLYVLDTGNHRVVILQDGEPVSLMGTRQGSTTDMLFPRSFFVDSDGKMYVANTGGNNVLVYGAGRLFLYTIGGMAGSDVYSFDQPSGIVVYGNSVYVSDSENGKIKYYSKKDRTYEGSVGSKGFGDGQLDGARGISIKDNLIYVADKGNNKIQIYGVDGSSVKSIRGAYGCVLSAPHGVAVNDEGVIFVADTWNNRIVVFDSDGGCLEVLNGRDDLNFSEPMGVFIDNSNRLYIADSGNNAIEVFQYTVDYETEGGASEKISNAEEALGSFTDLVSAASYLEISYQDPATPLLNLAKDEFAKGNYMNAYFNATLSISKSSLFSSQLSSSIHSEVLRIVLVDDEALDKIDSDSQKYNVDADTSQLRSEISGIRQMLNEGRYSDAAFNVTAVHSRVEDLKKKFSGSTGVNIDTRDSIWLEISQLRNELRDLTVNASQYGLNVDSVAISAKLDIAYALCGQFNFESCQTQLSEAGIMLGDAKKNISAHIEKVGSVRKKISDAYEQLNNVHSSSFFMKPDLGSVERRLSKAESILDDDPEGALELVDTALMLIEDKRSEVDGTNQLALVGIMLFVIIGMAAVGVYYVRRGKSKKKPKLPKPKRS
ncbi:MAG: NHL repeat-containing protein [Candidatus Micrarchaeota archaeon]